MSDYTKYTKQEMQAYAIAKNIKENQIVIVGTGLPLIGAPLTVDEADYLVIESTYGNRLHEKAGDTVAELAALAGTIPYELLCGVSLRVPRIYTEN